MKKLCLLSVVLLLASCGDPEAKKCETLNSSNNMDCNCLKKLAEKEQLPFTDLLDFFAKVESGKEDLENMMQAQTNDEQTQKIMKIIAEADEACGNDAARKEDAE